MLLCLSLENISNSSVMKCRRKKKSLLFSINRNSSHVWEEKWIFTEMFLFLFDYMNEWFHWNNLFRMKKDYFNPFEIPCRNFPLLTEGYSCLFSLPMRKYFGKQVLLKKRKKALILHHVFLLFLIIWKSVAFLGRIQR